MDRRSVLRAAVAAGAVTLGGTIADPARALASPASSAGTNRKKEPTARDVAYRRWTTATDFATGAPAGVAVTGDSLTIASPVGQLSYPDPHKGTTADYEYATWTSARVPIGFTGTELIPSWTADTPGGTWLQVELRGVTELGNTTKWYNLGRWAADDNQIYRTSVPSQGDTDGYVAIDTYVAAAGHGWSAFDLRVTLFRPAGSSQTPALRSVGVMASRLPEPGKLTASIPQAAQGVILDVPRYSQNIHTGEYPQWDGGGQAWCSPTSTSMILAYWGTGPTPQEYAWVDPSYADPWVDHAARHTYDYSYDGCGNWPFNIGYAGRYGMEGLVTRLRSLNEAEQFIAAGIPLVMSLSFKRNQIPGLDYGTNGHLLVLSGFTAEGQPVLNDPASPDNASVRKTVGRAEFESAWLNSSRGVVYIIHPPSTALPAAPGQPNW